MVACGPGSSTQVTEAHLAVVGPFLSDHPALSHGSNVQLAETLEGSRCRALVWERGVGETPACGTGMVAAAFVATKTDGFDGPIVVETPGGEGQVEFRDGVAWLRGPAEYVFRGNVGER